MKIHLKSTQLDLTPSLSMYVEKKLATLGKFVKRFDEAGVAALWVEVARTTRHHYKGDVFMAEADLRLPGKILRAAATQADIHAAIDELREKLLMEIKKYKTKTSPRHTR